MGAVRSAFSPSPRPPQYPARNGIRDWDTRRVRDTMISFEEVPLLTEDERAVAAITELSAPRANRALVVDDGLLAGLLSITDLARALEVGRRPAQAQGDR